MKLHLIQSAEPMKDGGDLTAACGATVSNAVMVFSAYLPVRAEANSLLMCRHCAEVPITERYLAILANGQELKNEEAA